MRSALPQLKLFFRMLITGRCAIRSDRSIRQAQGQASSQNQDWIASDKTYTCRFGIGMLMMHYLDKDFKPEYLELPQKVDSEEYYVKMMIAWFYATALANQWDATIPYIEEHRLSDWVHKKTIQKACESYRITDEQKAYLKTLR